MLWICIVCTHILWSSYTYVCHMTSIFIHFEIHSIIHISSQWDVNHTSLRRQSICREEGWNPVQHLLERAEPQHQKRVWSVQESPGMSPGSRSVAVKSAVKSPTYSGEPDHFLTHPQSHVVFAWMSVGIPWPTTHVSLIYGMSFIGFIWIYRVVPRPQGNDGGLGPHIFPWPRCPRRKLPTLPIIQGHPQFAGPVRRRGNASWVRGLSDFFGTGNPWKPPVPVEKMNEALNKIWMKYEWNMNEI